MKLLNLREEDNGYGLLEVLASMAILAMAATMFTAGMLGALKLQADARRERAGLSGLEREAAEEAEPDRYKRLSLTIVFEGIRLDTKAGLGIYESEDERAALRVLVPRTGRGDTDDEE